MASGKIAASASGLIGLPSGLNGGAGGFGKSATTLYHSRGMSASSSRIFTCDIARVPPSAFAAPLNQPNWNFLLLARSTGRVQGEPERRGGTAAGWNEGQKPRESVSQEGRPFGGWRVNAKRSKD